MVSAYIIAFAIASQEVAADKTTCNFKGSFGSMKYECSVKDTVKSCCDFTIALSKCGDDADCITKAFENADGFDMEKLQDPDYVKSKCPVLGSLGEDKDAMEKHCKIDMGDKVPIDEKLLKTDTCSFGDDDFSCTVPGVKDICCTLTKAMMPCGAGETAKSLSCQHAEFLKLLPKLEAAGIDLEMSEDVAYQAKFCPVMASLGDEANQKKYCKGKTTRLFSLFKPGDALTSVPAKTNMAFGVFCGVAVVTSFAVVMRRRWQATSVETHEPLEVELQAEQGLVE